MCHAAVVAVTVVIFTSTVMINFVCFHLYSHPAPTEWIMYIFLVVVQNVLKWQGQSPGTGYCCCQTNNWTRRSSTKSRVNSHHPPQLPVWRTWKSGIRNTKEAQPGWIEFSDFPLLGGKLEGVAKEGNENANLLFLPYKRAQWIRSPSCEEEKMLRKILLPISFVMIVGFFFVVEEKSIPTRSEFSL